MTERDPRVFAPLSLDDLFALELPEIEWAVEEILPLGAAGLLSAREKAGKGLLAIDLCASIALGETFLDRAVREGAAVYCAAEEHLRDVRARIAARVGDRRDAPLYVLPLDGSTPDRLKLDDPGSMQLLWDMVVALEPVIVVLDTLREFHDRKEDSSDEMGPLLRPVRQLAHQTNTTVLVNHHQNKQGGFRGSTAIRAAFDLEWAFQRTDDPDEQGPARGTLRVEGRHGPRQVVNVRLGDGLRWEPDQALIVPRDSAIRERILAHLEREDGWRTAREIAAGLGAADKTVQNALAAMVQEVPRPLAVEGTGTRNGPRRYRSLAPGLPGLDGGVDAQGCEIAAPEDGSLGESVGGDHSEGTNGNGMVPPDLPAYGNELGRNHIPGPSDIEMISPEAVPRGGRSGGNRPSSWGRRGTAKPGVGGEAGADRWTR